MLASVPGPLHYPGIFCRYWRTEAQFVHQHIHKERTVILIRRTRYVAALSQTTTPSGWA